MKNIKYQSSILAGIYYLLTIILIILEYTFISIQKNEIVQQCQGSFPLIPQHYYKIFFLST